MNRCFRFFLVALALASAGAASAQISVTAATSVTTIDTTTTSVGSTTTATTSLGGVTSTHVLGIRKFPANVKRGELLVGSAPAVTLDAKADRLSPAVRIRDINNNLILSGTLSGKKLVVNYLRDNIGLIQQVWILNAEEAKVKLDGDGEMTIMSTIRSVFEPAKPVRPRDDGKTPFDQLPKF